MRTGLDATQLALLNSDKKTNISWLFQITLAGSGSPDYYWSTETRSWDGHDYTYKINDFSNISMDGGNEAYGIHSPANVNIKINNPSNTYIPSDFKNASIKIMLIIQADYLGSPSEKEILSWGFIVRQSNSIYQTISVDCVDFLTPYLEGTYPNTLSPQELFPVAKMADDNYCIPKIWGECFFPVRWTRDAVNDFYILGENGTYTVSELRSPQEWGGNSTWLSSEPKNTFEQIIKTGSDENDYKCCRFLIADSNNDGTCDANGIFGEGDPFLDAPCRMSNASTVSKSNPIEIIQDILLDYGLSSDYIDSTSYTDAWTIWDNRGLTFKVPLFYTQDKKELITKLLTLCNTSLVVRDKLYFKVFSATSQETIDKSWVTKNRDVGEGNFRIRNVSILDENDGCYINYIQPDEPCTDLIKALVPVSGSSTNPADNTIEAEYIDDSTNAQKIGILTAQRLYGRDFEVMSKLKSKGAIFECNDVITIDPEDYNALSSNYDVIINHISISRTVEIDMIATKYIHTLQNWDDLTVTEVTVVDEEMNSFKTVISGSNTPGIAGGSTSLNIMHGILRIGGDDAHIELNSDDSYISIGDSPPKTYGNNAGIWIGIDSGTPKMSLYKDANNYLQYNGTSLIIKSELHATGSSTVFDKNVDDLSNIAGDLDDISDGGTYARIKSASTQNNDILLAKAIGSLDNIDNGSSYSKVLATSITAGKIIMAQIDGDLDDVSNGSSYGKVNLTSISGGNILLSSCSGNLDNIANGSTYSKVATTKIYAGGIIFNTSQAPTEANSGSLNSEVVLSSNYGLRMRDSSGNIRVSIGLDGNFTFGNYSGGEGVNWNGSTLAVRGSLTAGDITSGGTIEGCTIYSRSSPTSNKSIILDGSTNEAYFYGNDGSGVKKVATIGIHSALYDNVIANFGTTTSSKVGVYAISSTEDGIYAQTNVLGHYAGVFQNASGDGIRVNTDYSNGVAIRAYSDSAGVYIDDSGGTLDYAIYTNDCTKGFLKVNPSYYANPNGNVSASKGTFYLSSTCKLYVNTNNSTAWELIGSQS